MPHLLGISEQLRIAIYHAIADLLTRRRKRREEERRPRERLAAESEQVAQRQRAIAQARLAALREEKDRLAGDARIRWLAGLAPSQRDAIAAKDERAAAVAHRAGGITSGRVQIRLACSARELNAWDKAGLLPHLFKRRIRWISAPRWRASGSPTTSRRPSRTSINGAARFIGAGPAECREPRDTWGLEVNAWCGTGRSKSEFS